jgi:hypothetical protein
MLVTWQSKHGHDSTEFTIIMANHNFATEVIDLRKIKAQPMTAVGEANHSTAVRAEQSANWPQSQSQQRVNQRKAMGGGAKHRRVEDLQRPDTMAAKWLQRVRANVTINRSPTHS